MMKSAISLLALSLLLVSCSHKQTSNSTERLAWYNNTLTNAYATVGRHNPKWDEPATQALAAFAEIRSGKSSADAGASIGDLAHDAVRAGCDDPMIRYLYCRYAPRNSSQPTAYWQKEARSAAMDMQASHYSPLLKFYAENLTANYLWVNHEQARWHDVVQFRRAAMGNLSAAVQDRSMPIDDVAAACEELLATIGQNTKESADAYKELETPLFYNWPNESKAYFIKARFYYRFAWQARGDGYAGQVTEKGWKGFKENLAIAETAYRKAWSLNPREPRIAAEMIEMAVSQQKDRAEMDLWFQRAMDLDTNNYAACAKKLRYLTPQWNGSREEMLAFGHACVDSKKWGGRVPLILADAHYQLAQFLDRQNRAEYWQQPEVWADLKAAFEKFFAINPSVGSRDRYTYANYAYACGQWQDFLAQIKWIRENLGTVDTEYFGGDDAFNQMLTKAGSGDAN